MVESKYFGNITNRGDVNFDCNPCCQLFLSFFYSLCRRPLKITKINNVQSLPEKTDINLKNSYQIFLISKCFLICGGRGGGQGDIYTGGGGGSKYIFAVYVICRAPEVFDTHRHKLPQQKRKASAGNKEPVCSELVIIDLILDI